VSSCIGNEPAESVDAVVADHGSITGKPEVSIETDNSGPVVKTVLRPQSGRTDASLRLVDDR
jgi:hypothetical protein